MSLGFRYNLNDLARLQKRLANLPQSIDLYGLAEALSAEGEAQTRRRISSEKSSPEGKAWEPWSEAYAATRHGGHSLLENEGDLLDSIQGFVEGTTAGWGTNLIYGATQHFGDEDRGIPSREYLGLSAENEADLVAVADDWIDSHIGAALH
ncbi:phage virion morphogenesis protein [Sulfuriflexus mobilis]|uniref:phage virion morphogenesis protein n=1 Tax=Sulfuriflexus mobilis TaxID=1811807 RepID=UPI000F84B74B|nr:phage virion morphogenesis protein [Sulfuriflexus mobilis]